MNDARRRAVGLLADGSALAVSLAATVLAFTAFRPSLPDPLLDGSWRYALATAAARAMPFGRDFVFTFGPLGIVYSGLRLPSQDALYLGFHVLLSIGLVAGFLLSSRPAMRPALVLLPVAVAASPTPDAVFFALPFTLVLGCGDRRLPPLPWRAAVLLLAACDGVLPLVKGTMSLPVAGCTAAAAGLLARRRSPWALAVPAVTAASALGAWWVAGQRLVDLPAYLRTQAEVASGYTDAMSVFGPTGGVLAYLAFAAAFVALWAAAAAPGRKAATALACALVGFVAFKAGFVRDDGHCLISASALLLFGLLLFLHAPPRPGIVGLALGVGGWAWVAHPYMDVSPRAAASRLVEAVSASAGSVVQRVRHPGRTFAGFERRRAEIADGLETFAGGGSYDVYPIDQTPLLALGLPWAPRPVVQSYSAYTPALAAMNAAHLAGAGAPDRLIFGVFSLDDRYPSLDDGASWPAILSRYDYLGFIGGASRLGRSASPHPATVGPPFLKRPIAFDEWVEVPPGAPQAVWATLDFHPSVAGHLASALFKAPLLFIDVAYGDGRTRTSRMVAGEGAAGFLLSPTVASTRDFVALKLGAGDLLAARVVRSFRLRQGAAYPFWGTEVDAALSPLAVSPDPADRDDVHGVIAAGPPLASIPAGGECAVDSVADAAAGTAPVRVESPAMPVDGWAMLSIAGKAENSGVRVALVDGNGTTFYARAADMRRQDLDAYFELPPDARVAFTSVVDVHSLHGRFALHVVQDGPEGPVSCSPGISVVVP